ncbi:MAG: STM4011 family radical SAM protein [Gemmataceae bacterium]|nr:STM4011 family radical SAM protein [Gemmata sp.]MDW8199255.1 STM4011 family radical SAM protein [Gemmataceae bacterium]
MNLSILYRGPLSSCNYACPYCPFAKRRETPAELAYDRRCLERFVSWVATRTGDSIGVLFTPWGEALIRKWYQSALVTLSSLPHVRKAAIQTNLSCQLDWVDACDKAKLALWCTFHPGETSRERFLAQCRVLLQRGVRFSVGVVGLKEHLAEIEALRRELPAEVYLWVNAYKRQREYYTPEMIADLTRIDPLFPLNNTFHASRGHSCRAGASVIAVDGEGTIRRCHFIPTPIGNIYDPNFADSLYERPCTNDTCGCHIGYVHLDRLKLYDTFGDGVLERIPYGFGESKPFLENLSHAHLSTE